MRKGRRNGLSMHLSAQISEWQSRRRKNDKCKNGMSACHLRSIWIFAAGIGGSKLREWADEKCLIRVVLSLPINEGGVTAGA